MKERFSIKIAGQSGQGINVLGEILIKAFKNVGFHTYGYREYPSLIKGGHASYQIDISDKVIKSSSNTVDVLLVLNRQSMVWYLDNFESGKTNTIFHVINNPRINEEELNIIKEKDIKFAYIPATKLAVEVGGDHLTGNIVSIGVIWKTLGLDPEALVNAVQEKFKDKPKIVDLDIACAKRGLEYDISEKPPLKKRLLRPNEISDEMKLSLHVSALQKINFDFKSNENSKNDYIMTGNEALALGAINAGVRVHYSYPMTPSSPILEILGALTHKTGMVVKQAEDEITAAGMAIGSMFMGTRALTATSGGGFDLMTEHVSLAGMIENPFVCVLGQRPGPATGLPTWTAQGDLMLAIYSGHGEFPRLVLAPKDPEDCFYMIQEAFNIAEEYQMPVIILTDKLVAESAYQVGKLDFEKIQINRGLITDEAELEQIKSTDRFKITETGISPRWLPGSKASDYNAQSDEHDEEGNITEDAEMSEKMISKRMRKMETLLGKLPDPIMYTNKTTLNTNLSTNYNQPTTTLSIISWGSNYGVIKDVMRHFADENVNVNYLHIEYLWPLKTEKIIEFLNKNPETILIESNYQGQLGKLIKMETGINIKNKILKWDGRPFFYDELIQKLLKIYN
jgi:2-oxoglutarate ferredoxin oxidoreductase subunit alpha